MKKLFAILMSFQLILAPVAFAQQKETGIDNYKASGDGSSEGNQKMLNSIMMTGSGVFGSLFMMCKKGVGLDSTPVLTPNTIPTFSHYLFMAGAIVLLLGEIVAATKQKERIKRTKEQVDRMVKATKPGEVETQEHKDVQLEILWKALEEEEFNAEALEERINWMGAAEVVYWLAVAGAVTEVILLAATKALMVTRTTARTLQYTTYATEVASCAGPQAIVLCAPATAATALAVAAHTAAIAAEKAVGYYSQTLYNCVTPANKGVVLGVAAAYGVIGGLTKEAGKGSEVGGALMGGLTVVGTMLLLMTILTAFAPGLNVAMTTAPARVVIFGVFAVLAETARNGYKQSLYRAKDNIAALKTAIQQWEQANIGGDTTGGTTGGGTDTGGTAGGATGGNSGGPPKIATLPKPLPKFPKLGKCLAANGEHSAKSCRTPVKFNRSVVKFKSKFLSSAAAQAFGMGEALAGDNAAAAFGMAANMGNNAARAKAEAMALIKEANAGAASRGEKGIDFDKAVKAQLASMSKQAADSAGMKGSSGASGSSATLDAEAKSDENKSDGKVAVAAPGGVSIPAPDLSLTGGEIPPAEEAVAEAPPQNLEDFESTVSDVAPGGGATIFEQVSNRYILNLSKMLVRKKDPEVATEPEAAATEPETLEKQE